MSYHILIAEDELSVQSALAEYLREKGMEVETASDGAQAIETLSARKPDLLLLDLLMPKANGVEVLGFVRERYGNLPVIVITNLSQNFDETQRKQWGVHEVLIKSDVSLADIDEAIRGILAA